MQEGCEDYYELSHIEEVYGCCLNCSEAEDGCLCKDCLCTKCFWYSAPEEFEEKGHCDKISKLKELRKKKAREWHLSKEKMEVIKSNKLEEENEKVLEMIKLSNEIPNWYVCQECKRDFVNIEEYKIIINKEPICKLCKGEL